MRDLPSQILKSGFPASVFLGRVVTLRFFQVPLVALFIGLIVARRTYSPHTRWTECKVEYRWHIAYLAISIAVYVATFAILKYLKLQTSHYEIFDAGLYDHKLWRIWNAEWQGKMTMAMVEGHFQPLTIVYAFLYGLNPTPYIPFLVETITLGSGAIPVYLLTQRKTNDSRLSLVVAITYLIYPAVQFNDVLGFHPDHIYLPALLWAFYFLEIQRYAAMSLALVLASMASTQWILGVMCFGIFISIYKKKWIMGGIVAFTSAALFILLLWVIFPYFNSHITANSLSSVQSPYSDLVQGNIMKLVAGVFTAKKLYFIFFLLGPFLFVPLFTPAVLIVSIPDFAKTLLSSEPLHHAVDGHYTLGIIAVLFVAYIHSLSKVNARFGINAMRSIAVLILVLTTGSNISNSPLPISVNFWFTKGVLPDFQYVNYRTDKRSETLEKLAGVVVPDVSMKIELSNSAYTPYLVHRTSPLKIFPSRNWKTADYVVLNLQGPQTSGAVSSLDEFRKEFDRSYSELSRGEQFEKVFDENSIEVWRRRM